MNVLRPEEAEPVRQHLAAWCAQRLGFSRVWEHCRTLGVFGEENLAAVVVYHDWAPESGVIEISAVSESRRWLTRNVLHEIFAYPFDRLGYQMVVARVSPDNMTSGGRGAVRIFRSFGFEEYRIPRLRGRHEDELIFTLTDDVWRAKMQRGNDGKSAKAA